MINFLFGKLCYPKIKVSAHKEEKKNKVRGIVLKIRWYPRDMGCNRRGAEPSYQNQVWSKAESKSSKKGADPSAGTVTQDEVTVKPFLNLHVRSTTAPRVQTSLSQLCALQRQKKIMNICKARAWSSGSIFVEEEEIHGL